MKKYAIILGAMLLSGTAIASDRLDIIAADGTFKSMMVDEISVINYVAGETEGTYTQLRVTQVGGKQILLDLKDIASIDYVLEDKTPFEIKAIDTDHARWRLLYNFNDPNYPGCIDPDKPYGWRGSESGGPVFWLLDVDKGWAASEIVTGQYTGTVYSERKGFVYVTVADDNKRYGINLDCQTFTMPFEPVTLTLVAEELSVYPDAPYLGEFKGHCLAPHSATWIDAGLAPHALLTVKANGTYTFAAHDIDVTDFYTPSKDDMRIDYIPAPEEEKKNEMDIDVRYGATVRYLDESRDWAIVSMLDVIDPRPDSRTNYLVGRPDYNFAMASSDGDGYRVLAEAKTAADTKWWLLENNAQDVTEVALSFISGTTIGEACEAKVMANGEVTMKFVNDGEPHFIFRGDEAGTYTGASGTLILDGFGEAMLNGEMYDYTAAGFLITIGDVNYQLDPSTHTYTIKAAAAWTGSATYSSTTITGSYAGGAERADSQVSVAFDSDYSGNAKDGYATVKITVKRTDGLGDRYTIVDGNAPYVFDAATNTLTVSGLWAGTVAGGLEKINIELKVADDMGSMYIASPTPRIYSMNRNGSYIVTGADAVLTRNE